jgi:hypothetical protein
LAGDSLPFQIYTDQGTFNCTIQSEQSQPGGVLTTVVIRLERGGPTFNIRNLYSTSPIQQGSDIINGALSYLDLIGTPLDDQGSNFSIFVQVNAEKVGDVPRGSLKRIHVSSNGIRTSRFDLGDAVNGLRGWLDNVLEQEGDSEYDQFFIDTYATHTIDSIVVGFYVPRGAGCWGNFSKFRFPLRLAKTRLSDLPSDRNNCFFACLYERFTAQLDDLIDLSNFHLMEKYQRIREVFAIANNVPINNKHIKEICTHLNVSVSVYKCKTVTGQRFDHEIGFDRIINEGFENMNILIANKHYGLIIDVNICSWKRCGTCCDWFNYDTGRGKGHIENCRKCPSCHARLTKNVHSCRPTRKKMRYGVTKNKKLSLVEYICNGAIYFADFETLPDPNIDLVVYSSAIVPIDAVVRYETEDVDMSKARCSEFYGIDGFEKFCTHLLTLSGTVVFYNGSRFDFYFILRWLVTKKITIRRLVRESKSNKLMIIEFENVRLWDLCLFTLCSLSKACESFGVPAKYCKKDFDHKKVQTWENAEEHRDEVIDYNQYDVVSLAILFVRFANAVWRLYGFNVIEAISLSHMAYEIWRNKWVSQEDLFKLKLPTKDEYDYIRKSLYGGRCSPQRQRFTSRHYNFIRRNWSSLDAERRADLFRNIADHLVYLDVVSLYPYSAVIGLFPIGGSRFLNEKELARCFNLLKTPLEYLSNDERNTILKGFFEVDVVCPKHLLTAFLLARDEKNNLLQDLTDKTKQIYDGHTLLEAKRLGYSVVGIHSALMYTDLGNPLRGYMLHAFKQKKNSAKDSIDYQTHKYLMNGLTGKFNQTFIDGRWEVFYDDNPLTAAGDIDLVKRFEWLLGEDNTIKGYMAEMLDPSAQPCKNIAIGVVILAISRVLMSVYTEYFKGYTDTACASYYGDTDSLIIHNDAYQEAKSRDVSKDVFSGKFGHLDDELGGSKIVKAILLAPKTYILEYITPSFERKWKVTAKGIPQYFKGMDVEKYYREWDADVEEENEDLKDICYSLCTQDRVLRTRKYLNMDFFDHMVDNDSCVVVSFGTIKRILFDKKKHNLVATLKIILDNERTINKEIWWRNGKRSYSLENFGYPRGHFNYR